MMTLICPLAKRAYPRIRDRQDTTERHPLLKELAKMFRGFASALKIGAHIACRKPMSTYCKDSRRLKKNKSREKSSPRPLKRLNSGCQKNNALSPTSERKPVLDKPTLTYIDGYSRALGGMKLALQYVD